MKILNNIFFKFKSGKFWVNHYDLTVTDVIRRKEKDLPLFGWRWKETKHWKLKWVQLIFNIQIRRKFILSKASPNTAPQMRENAYKQGFHPSRETSTNQLRNSMRLSLDFLPVSLTERSYLKSPSTRQSRSWEPETEKSEHNRYLRLPYIRLLKDREEKSLKFIW